MSTLLTVLLLCLSVLLAGYLFLICPRLGRHRRMIPYHGQRFAHRGYHHMARHIPENSMAAFQAAVEEHMGIELDVHLSADGQIVVFHDDTLTRMCGVNRTVESLTASQLTGLALQNTDQKIPLLRDVLVLVQGRVPLLIELKMPTSDTELCSRLQQLLDRYNGPYLIQSFNALALRWYKKNAPAILRGQLSSNLVRDNRKSPVLLRFLVQHLLTNAFGRPDFISYKYRDRRNLSLRLNQYLFGAPVAVWTLRTKKDYENAAAHYQMMIFEKLS